MLCAEEAGARGWRDAEGKAVSDGVTRFGVEQQTATARVQSKVKYYVRQRIELIRETKLAAAAAVVEKEQP